MATTVRQIIQAAHGRSTFNDPDKLATEKELVGVVDRRIKQLYSHVSKLNPHYFGAQASVAFADGGWAKPAAAELVFRIEDVDDEEVTVVPIDDREAEFAPRVYRLGATYYTVGDTDDPTDEDTLTFFYSRIPTTLSTGTAELDSSWPEQFNDILILHVARYLAVKDQRPDEAAVFDEELRSLVADFEAHVVEADPATVGRLDQPTRRLSLRPILPPSEA